LLATVAILALAGCGDAEEKRIASVLTSGLTSADPKAVCEGALSPRLLMRIYGSTDKCHQVERQDSERVSRAQSVRIVNVQTHGHEATAVIELHGGTRDGARGRLSLSRLDGGWRVTDLSVGLLRSQFEAGLRTAQQLDPGLRLCMMRKMRAVHDDDFRELAFSADAVAQRRLAGAARRCAALIETSAKQAL